MEDNVSAEIAGRKKMEHIVTLTYLHRRDVLHMTDSVYYCRTLVSAFAKSGTAHNIFMVISKDITWY